MTARNAGLEIAPKKLNGFERWLNQNGAEIVPPTNPYEAIRFKSQYGTGVLYRKENGRFSFNSEVAKQAFDCFRQCRPWSGVPKLPRQKKKNRTIRILLGRDGGDCFYCAKPMVEGDISVEHLVNLVHGGTNSLSNKVLAHIKCNNEADCLPLVDKIKLRDEMRARA